MAVDDTTEIKAALVLGERAHIQDRVWGNALTDMADTYRWYKLGINVPSESGNAFAITVQLQEENGTSTTGAKTFHAQLYDNNMIEEVTAAYTITVGGSATANSGAAQAGANFTLTAAGTATLTVTDISATSTETIWIKLTPDGHMGPEQWQSMTFA